MASNKPVLRVSMPNQPLFTEKKNEKYHDCEKIPQKPQKPGKMRKYAMLSGRFS
jgi:hypothetical protein